MMCRSVRQTPAPPILTMMSNGDVVAGGYFTMAGGVIAMLAFCIVINIGMTAGMFPIVGIPLPLMSYGGSATVMTLSALGLLLNIKRRRLTLFY